MLLRTTLIIALSAPLLVNCSAVLEGLEGKAPTDDPAPAETLIESPRRASALGNPVEEGAIDCVPKDGYGQAPEGGKGEGGKGDTGKGETDYPTDNTPPAGDTEQNQSPSQSGDPNKNPSQSGDPKDGDKPASDTPGKEDPKGGDKTGSDTPGKGQPVEDCK